MTQSARAANSGELTLLRTPGDWTRAFIAIYKPNVIYTARLNGAPSSTDMVGDISFDGGGGGTLTDIRAEMTLWVGSFAGARNLGVCRIRKDADEDTFYIGYTSEIAWSDNCYLTIVDHAILSKKPARMSGGAVLMDGEHAYTNQHTVFDPVPVLSCHAVGTLLDGEVAFVWNASHSWVFDSTIASYLWEAPGSLSIDDDTSATPTITYNSAGNHPVYCTITAANGKSATGIQFAFRFDATHKPHLCVAQAPSIDYDTGGWSYKIKMHADADPTNVIEGALCVLFADDYYGNTKQSIGQLENRENIICWGYIAGDESIDWNAEISSVEFTVQGPHYWLKQIETDPVILAMATSAVDSWGVMPALTVDRYLWHALHWRSNATALLNITLIGDARYAPSLGSADGSLWSQMEEVAWRKLFGRIGCDRYGRFFAVIDPQCVPESERTWATVMTITKKDWRERVDVKRNTQRKLAMLSTSGWVVDLSAAVSTLYSLSMGHINGKYGGGEIIDQLLVTSQAQFNQLTGLYMGWKNNELEFDFSLSQNNRMVDLFPNQFLDVSLLESDTTRGKAYSGKLIPRSITLQPDPETGCWSTEISCEAETFAELAIDGDIPVSAFESAEDAALWDDMSYPLESDFATMPLLKNITYPSPTDAPNNHPKSVIGYGSMGVFYTKDFDVDQPTWYFMNSGLETFDRTQITNMIVTPIGRIYILTNGDPYSGWQKVFVTDGLGGAWREVFNASRYPEAGSVINGLGVNPLENDQVAIFGGNPWNPLGGGNEGAYYFSLVNNSVFTLGDPLLGSWDWLDPRVCRASVIYANNGWNVSSNRGVFAGPALWRISSTGTLLALTDLPGNVPIRHDGCGAGTQDLTYTWSGGVLCKVTVNGTIIEGQSIIPPAGQGVAFSPTGNFGMGASGTTPYKTSDGGATWVIATAVIPIGPTVWENCGDDFRWVFGAGAYVRLTMDWGVTYVDKSGNLPLIAPLSTLAGIRFIE